MGATSAGLRLEGLTKTYRTPEGPVFAVRGVDLAVAAGETVALLGPNGAGKSTTVDMLLGLSRPDAGRVTVFGATPAEAVAAGRVGAMLQTGWNRQLRITPLSAWSYLRAKVVTAYALALLSLLALYGAGAAYGVRLPAGQWLGMTALIVVGLVPFAGLGIALGHLLTTDAFGPVIGGGTALLAFVSGTWFPLGDSGFIHDLAQWLPSYWLVQANRVALGGSGWGAHGWAVVLAWAVGLCALATWAFRRDTARG